MSTTLNHVALSRAQLAQASELADAGSTALAHSHLQLAADHAGRALDARVDADFDAVQEAIDAYMARPVDPVPPAIPLYGGPHGAMNARGAEAAERYLKRIVAAFRRD